MPCAVTFPQSNRFFTYLHLFSFSILATPSAGVFIDRLHLVAAHWNGAYIEEPLTHVFSETMPAIHLQVGKHWKHQLLFDLFLTPFPVFFSQSQSIASLAINDSSVPCFKQAVARVHLTLPVYRQTSSCMCGCQ